MKKQKVFIPFCELKDGVVTAHKRECEGYFFTTAELKELITAAWETGCCIANYEKDMELQKPHLKEYIEWLNIK